MSFEQRYAGHMVQQPVDVGRSGQRQPTQGPSAVDVDGEHRPGAPREPLEEVVGVARPCPEARVTDLAAVGVIGLECGKFAVGYRFTEKGRHEDEGGQAILQI